jgi:hypothetical protein
MNKLILKVLSFFGVFEKFRKWMQGKKTYAVNISQALAGIAAMIVVSGQMLELASKTISLVLGWSDTSQGSNDVITSIQILWSSHAEMAAAFSAGLYAMLDAFSKMAAYASAQRLANK